MTHQLYQEAKSSRCYLQEISDPADGFVGTGFQRAKPGSGETSQNPITDFP